jgi:sulfotransferase family protein
MAPFIVGVPRSGTTLLRIMLDAHPRLAIPPETGFLSRLVRLPWLWPAGLGRRRLLAIITRAQSWPDFHLDAPALAEALEAVKPFTLAHGLRAFYRLYAARFNKSLWGDKTPLYGRHAYAIARLLPEARFIHVIRDGRDVALSLRTMWFAPSQRVDALARYWARELQRARRQGQSLEYYKEIRYEALIQNPEQVLRDICQFLELDFHPRMLSYHENAATRLAEHEGRTTASGTVWLTKAQRQSQQWQTRKPVDVSRIGRWRAELDIADAVAFEHVAGGLLRELGYPSVNGASKAATGSTP